MGVVADFIGRVGKGIAFIGTNLKALFVRLLFAIHGIITVWRITDVYHDPLYYLLCIPIGLLLVEMIVTANCTENGEWKWFCPSVFLYLCSVIPGIWLLQMDLYESRETYRRQNDLSECSQIVFNTSGLRDIEGVSIPVALSADQWALALEQILFFVLIMGRWLLPKGQLTRDQLSQLLLVYVGIAADSLEFSLETLKIEQVICDLLLIVLILGIWSWSLLQFTLVLTSVSAPRPRMARVERARQIFGGCWENEIWALIITMMLQDAPYLTMRLYLMIKSGAINQLMLFFTIKNSILVCLQLYRMAVLCCCSPNNEQVKPLSFVNEEEMGSNIESDSNKIMERIDGKSNDICLATVTADEGLNKQTGNGDYDK